MAAERSQNLQDTFLNHVRKNKIPLTIFLVNEEKSYAYNTRFRIPVNTVDPFHFFTYVNQWWLSTPRTR